MTQDDEEYLTLSVALQRLPISRRQLYRYAKDGRIRVRPVIGGGQVYHAGDVADLAAKLRADRERADRERSTAVTPARRDTDLTELLALREELRDVAEGLRNAGLSRTDREAAEHQAREQGERLDRAIAALETAAARPRWPRSAVIVAVVLLVAVAVLVTLSVLGVL